MAEERSYKAHVIVFPFIGHGHINPMLQFSKRLAFKGLKVTVAALLSNTKTMAAETGSSIMFEPIYDDCAPENGTRGPGGFKGFVERFEASAFQNLAELITKQQSSEYPVKCLIYDANLPQALYIAKQLGIAGAAFFTQSCATIASYYPMHYELLGQQLPVPAFSMPGLPEMALPNLPSFGSDTGRCPPIMRYILNQFSTIENADWVLFNSYDKLEEEVLKWMSNLWPVRAIGPTILSIYLDRRVENHDGCNSFKQDKEDCIKWLNTKETGSVVYVSFGSAAALSAEQMIEMAKALKHMDSSFLWVVKPTEESRLPVGFREETSQKGLIVSWCPQYEVLAHQAVGCFITHCGWNSTLEAISFGIPMVAMPQYLDQMINAFFVEQVWGVGVKPKVDDDKDIASWEEIIRCIEEAMSGGRGQEIQKNAIAWKKLAWEAVNENGSSDKHIEEIIDSLSTT